MGEAPAGQFAEADGWNPFRFCIGPAPDFWFDIANEAGLLIQNEFFIWNGRCNFPRYKEKELITQYRDWMRDHWPWDNGYSVPSGPDDPAEEHAYLFSRLRSGGSTPG